MKILVAGIGNIFFGDDGFGPAVVEALRERGAVWPGVEVRDFGIRGMDLAFALTSGIECAILVDAVPRGGAPGTLYVIDPDVGVGEVALDNHAMDPIAVLRLASSIGEPPRTLRLIGCEPAHLADPEGDIAVGLSVPVAAAIGAAADLVAQLVEEARCTS